MMTMMKAVNKLLIKKGRTEEVLQRFAKPKSVHTFDGFVVMEVLKKTDNEEYDELFISTTWEDYAYFEAWRGSRATEKAHSSKKEKQDANSSPILGNELSLYEVVFQHRPVE